MFCYFFAPVTACIVPIHLIRLAALSGAGEAVDGLGSSGARRTLSQGLKEKKERKQ